MQDQSARKLLGGPDGDTLRANNKTTRIGFVHDFLRACDPYCATRAAAEPIADAIGRIAGPRRRG